MRSLIKVPEDTNKMKIETSVDIEKNRRTEDDEEVDD